MGEMIEKGKRVEVINKELSTFGMKGLLVSNDATDRDYKVEFDKQWVGYYKEGDLIEISTQTINVYKYKLYPPKTTLELPVGSKILTVHSQRHDVCIWIEIPNSHSIEKREFVSLPTGKEWEFESKREYIGTVFVDEDVFHIYELLKGEKNAIS
jgi:hypothetical protein